MSGFSLRYHNLLNAVGDLINPATEDKQDATIVALSDGSQLVMLADDTGVKINGANPLPTRDIDIHDYLVNEHAFLDLGVSDTFAIAGAIGDNVINVTNGALFAVNDIIDISENSVVETNHSQILSIATNALTIDTPLENNYTTAAVVKTVLLNMGAAAGTVTVPITYKITPPAGETWSISRMLIAAVDATAMDDGTFAGMAALINGMVIRLNSANVKENLAVWRSNGDIAEDTYGVIYVSNPPTGEYGMRALWPFSEMKAGLKLVGDTSDSLDIIIQDTLNIDEFKIKFQGHKV